MKKIWLVLSLLIVGALLFACASSRVYINEEADFGFYQTVGVVPFSNMSNDRAASDKVTADWVTELLIGRKVQVATMGDFVTAQGLPADSLEHWETIVAGAEINPRKVKTFLNDLNLAWALLNSKEFLYRH